MLLVDKYTDLSDTFDRSVHYETNCFQSRPQSYQRGQTPRQTIFPLYYTTHLMTKLSLQCHRASPPSPPLLPKCRLRWRSELRRSRLLNISYQDYLKMVNFHSQLSHTSTLVHFFIVKKKHALIPNVIICLPLPIL